MSKIAIYARVSTVLHQHFERQISDLTTIIKEHNNKLNIPFDFDNDVEVYAEKISGFKKNTERVELTKLLDKIENDPSSISHLYISEISRLGRDPSDTRKVIDRLTDLGIPIYIDSIKQSTIENGKRNTTMNIVIQILMEFAAAEAESIKIRMMSGKLEKVSKGRTSGNNEAYGYWSDEDKMLVINPSEAEVVKQIFLLYKEGKGTKVIADILNQLEIPTRLATTHKDKILTFSKTNIEKSGSEIKWDGNTILQIIKNTIYKGERNFKGHIFPIESIISIELFDECNSIRKAKSHRNYLTSYEYLLRNLIRCGCCGKKYIGKYSPVKGGDKVYKCTSFLQSSNIPKCGQLSINISQVESIIYDQLLKSDSILKYLDNPKDIKRKTEKELETLEQNKLIKQAELESANNQMSKLFDLYSTGNKMNKEFYSQKEFEILKTIKTVNDKLEIIKANIVSHKITLSKYDEKKASTDMLLKAKDNRVELTTIFQQFIDKIVIYNFNKQYTLLNIYIKVNGIVLKTPLKTLIDLKGVKSVRHQAKRYYKYLSIHKMDNEPIINEKFKLINDLNEMYTELENIVYWATQDNFDDTFNLTRFQEVPVENYIYINRTDI